MLMGMKKALYRVVILIGDVFACAQLNSQSNLNNSPIYRALVLIGLGIQLRAGKNMSNQNNKPL